jgi:AcrR family transcriptional regulator
MLPPSPVSATTTAAPALRKGEQTRMVLLAAARTVFAREGFLRAEISQITREAGKSNGVFYNYFTNKNDLLRQLVDAFREDLRAGGLRSPANAPQDIEKILITLWETYKAHAPTFVALTEAAAINAEFAEPYHSLRRAAQEDFSGMIRARQQAGFCGEFDADYTAIALETMITYCMYEWLARGAGGFSDTAREYTAFQTLTAIMRTVFAL